MLTSESITGAMETFFWKVPGHVSPLERKGGAAAPKTYGLKMRGE